MDKLLTDIIGKMPIVLDDFRFVDSIFRSAFVSYLKGIKAENCILYGCEITHIDGDEYEVSEGAVAINAEVFVCEQAKFTATNLDKYFFTIFESFDPTGLKIFGDNVKHNTYLLRRVKIIQYDEQPANTLSINAKKLEELLIYEGDSRLSDSRKCNNEFDDAAIARDNLNVYSKSQVYHKNNTYNKSETYSKTETYNKTEVNNKLNNKVDKVSGKQLSTNDFTNALKNKLDNIANNANNYTHPSSHPITMINDAGNYVKMTRSERKSIAMISNISNMISSFLYKGSVYIGDVVDGNFVRVFFEKTLPTANYMVLGSLVGTGDHWNNENDAFFTIYKKTPIYFELLLREASEDSQHLKFEYMIVAF